MSMEIKGYYNDSKINYAEQMKEKQGLQRAREEGKGDNGANAVKEAGQMSEPQDEYISSEKSGVRPAGLYRVGQDEKGNKRIFFDNPDKSRSVDERKEPKANGDNEGKAVEECTGNTDQVEREIRKLKEEKQKLEQQLRVASGDEEKVRELEKKLAQVESELSRKDNDTYRRQNTFFY